MSTTHGSFDPKKREWRSPETENAFYWLVASGSAPARELEEIMRNYQLPAYDMVDVGRRLLKVLGMPKARFGGDSNKVDLLDLAEAVIEYGISKGWDVVEEPDVAGRDAGGST